MCHELRLLMPDACLCVSRHTTTFACVRSTPLTAETCNGEQPAQGLLRAAASLGHLQLVHLLLTLLGDSHAVAAHDGSGSTALHAAAAAGHAAVVQCLLSAAPDSVAAVDKAGRTALMAAVEGGYLEAARVLLSASPKAAGAADKMGVTALHLASKSAEMTEMLLQQAPSSLVAARRSILTPLHCAAA